MSTVNGFVVLLDDMDEWNYWQLFRFPFEQLSTLMECLED
jgi:hypothetical protein